MGHLTARGWIHKNELISADEYAEFRQRTSESHTAQWRADVRRWVNGEQVDLAIGLPVTGGSLTMDSSDLIRNHLTLEIGGGEEWIPTSASSALSPWGAVIHLYVRMDRSGGGWMNWLKVFEGPIRETVYERPSLFVTVQCADRSSTMAEYLHTRRRGYGGQNLVQAISDMVNAALPVEVYNVFASAGAYDVDVDQFVADPGQSRLETANDLAAKWGYELFMDFASDAIIRRDLTDDDDASWDPSEVGPDIGDVARPVATLRDGEGGNLLGITTTLSRDDAVNGVAVNLGATRDKCHPNALLHWHHLETVDSGPIAWSDRVGRIPLVEEEKSVRRITPELQDRQVRRARHLLKRRRGMSRFHDLAVLPAYWLTPDDRVRIIVGGVEEHHYVSRIDLDLGGGPMRIRTRTLSTPTA